jgi:hypothetical protein
MWEPPLAFTRPSMRPLAVVSNVPVLSKFLSCACQKIPRYSVRGSYWRATMPYQFLQQPVIFAYGVSNLDR